MALQGSTPVDTLGAAPASPARRLSAGLVRAAAALAAAWLAVPAAAHELYLVPGAFAAAPGEQLAVGIRLGPPGEAEPVARDPSRIVRFTALGPAGEVAVDGAAGAEPAGGLQLGAAGLYAVGYVTRPSLSVLAAEPFERYLEEEGLDWVVVARRADGATGSPGRELFYRSAKVLVHAGSASGGELDRPLGLPLELLREPATAGRLRLRLLYQGRPAAGVLVALRPLGGGAPRSARSDVEGRVDLAGGPGQWLAHAVHMVAAGDPAAEWESAWASLTFAEPESRTTGWTAASAEEATTVCNRD